MEIAWPYYFNSKAVCFKGERSSEIINRIEKEIIVEKDVQSVFDVEEGVLVQSTWTDMFEDDTTFDIDDASILIQSNNSGMPENGVAQICVIVSLHISRSKLTRSPNAMGRMLMNMSV